MKVEIDIPWDMILRSIRSEPNIARALREVLGIKDDCLQVYGSRPPHSPPPGRSFSWMTTNARFIPGHTRHGGKRGRSVTWTCTSDQYRSWLAAKEEMAEQRVKTSDRYDESLSSDISDSDLDDAIRGAGYRLRAVGGGRK